VTVRTLALITRTVFLRVGLLMILIDIFHVRTFMWRLHIIFNALLYAVKSVAGFYMEDITTRCVCMCIFLVIAKSANLAK